MPRQARLDYPGILYHVISRGIERSNIFKRISEKGEFLRRLTELLEQSSMQCYAWCIMDNHFHLLLLTGNTKLADFMRRLLTGYAVYYNKTHKRSGHLFQNRYKSIVCDKDNYLLLLIRYIHLNPVRARLINMDKLAAYEWTGHAEILKGKTKYRVIERNEVLSYFGKKEGEAKRAYVEFVKDGVDLKEDYTGGGLIRSAGGVRSLLKRSFKDRESFDERILGLGGFVEEVLNKADNIEKVSLKIEQIDDLLERISKYYDLDKNDIMKTRTKKVRKARCLLVFMGSEYAKKSVTEMGRMLGVTQEAASIAKKKGRRIFEENNLEQKIVL